MRAKFVGRCALAGLGMLALAACQSATTGTNVGPSVQGSQAVAGSPTTVSEKIAGAGYSTYLAASAAWAGYLESGHAKASVVASVRPKRQAARVALDRLASASTGGDLSAADAAFQVAVGAWIDAMKGNGISVGKTP